jgi:uncharacterized protein (UPF0371 family)
MNQYETLTYLNKGFDNDKYLKLQKEGIEKRISLFSQGRLYLEIGGKLFFDAHAARVLPGFDPKNKVLILKEFRGKADLLFCVSAKDILGNRQLSNTNKGYTEATIEMLAELERGLEMKPKVVINLISEDNRAAAEEYAQKVEILGYETFLRYIIAGYPAPASVLDVNGYGKDEYTPVTHNLVIVTGAASNSGKMSTCLGQIYLEFTQGKRSGYAKYETFPIWNLPLEHPVNLAYEAATADIEDYNLMDELHLKAYGIEAVNYNRDVQAFGIVSEVGKKIGLMQEYRSPTDMGISMGGMAITNDEIISVASFNEVDRRIGWYNEIVQRGEGKKEWVEKCEQLKRKASGYLSSKGYNPNLLI